VRYVAKIIKTANLTFRSSDQVSFTVLNKLS